MKKPHLITAGLLALAAIAAAQATTATQSFIRVLQVAGEVQVAAKDRSLVDSEIHSWSITTQQGDGLLTSEWVCPPGYKARIERVVLGGNAPGPVNLTGLSYIRSGSGVQVHLSEGMMLHPGDIARFWVNWDNSNNPGPYTHQGVMQFVLVEI